MKKENAITLIALIITIIILLILAGITISSLTGENGLIKKVEQAKQKAVEAEVKEKVELILSDYQLAKTNNNELKLIDFLEEKKNEKAIDSVADNSNGTIIVSINGYNVIIDKENIEVASINEISAIIVTYEITGYNKETEKVNIFIMLESDANIKKIVCPDNDVINITDNKTKVAIDYEVTDGEKYKFIAETTDGNRTYVVQTKGISKNGKVCSAEDLQEMATLVNFGCDYENKTVTLNKDIDLSSVCGADKGSWIPIGNTTNQFNGTFDGDDNGINNIYINNSESYQGLFGVLGEKGKIRNITIDGEMTSYYALGGVVGMNYGIIECCVNNANLITSNHICAGICARNAGIVYKCINNGNICSSNSSGGVVGLNGVFNDTGYIIECINHGTIATSSSGASGITSNAGGGGTESRGYVCNSYNTGNITTGQFKAGIVGVKEPGGGCLYVYNCYNRGNVYGGSDIFCYDGAGPGERRLENNYGVADATVEELNVQSNIPEELQNIGLYRNNAYVLKDGKIVLDWE